MIQRAWFADGPDGRAVEAFTLSSDGGLRVTAINHGCIITSILAPDRQGVPGEVVLGHDDLEGYLRSKTYFGALVGRYANRIRGGRFSLDGVPYQLTINEGRHHLHGGTCGFDSRWWSAEEVRSAQGDAVVFSRTSPDGEEGYPGTLKVRVAYQVTPANELRIGYEAAADAATIVNLTQHSYFDLSAGRARDVLDHLLAIHAEAFTPIDADGIPTGEIQIVQGTPFDFREPRRIGERIDAPVEQLAHVGGYDHNWVLRPGGTGVRLAAMLADPESGRTLEVLTTEPGLQFYSGNKLDGRARGRGRQYGFRAGLCLETQRFPNGPNEPRFPPAILRPGELFRSTTVFRFGAL
ncbi:MAG TPA: aldose epimerase family protein [Vicinamibacterales bacterium]|nr:aldose epimerase family protein [Vicinamibacterales bacterium]